MQEAGESRAHRPTLKDRVEAYERALIKAALAATAGNQRQAAFQLGVLPTTLHEKMKRLRMIPQTSRQPAVGERETGGDAYPALPFTTEPFPAAAR
jgi:DNA-binding NtrC family response regulator